MTSHAELQADSEARWLRADATLRDRCVWHLRDRIPDPEDRAEIAWYFDSGTFPSFFHFSTGMWVRNTLREVARDDELPTVRYPSGGEFANWDDYYMAALRQAVAPEEGEV